MVRGIAREMAVWGDAIGWLQAPPMSVTTLLTTEQVDSQHHKRTGKRLDQGGRAT